jgi:alpha-glucosidase
MILPMNRYCWLPALLAIGLIGCAGTHSPQIVTSPDGKIEAIVQTTSSLAYSVKVDGQTVLSNSSLGMDIGTALGPNVDLVKVERHHEDSTWENRLGKRRRVLDRHNELTLTLRDRATEERVFQVIFRVFDDGVAFRYVVPEQPGAKTVLLTREMTSFRLPSDATCFAGSQPNGFTGPQEWEFWPTNLGALPADRPTGLPLLVHAKPAWIAIGESDLLDYPGMWLTTSVDAPPPPPTAKHTAQAPRPATMPLREDAVTLYAHFAPRADGNGVAKLDLPHRTPWRVIMIARKPGQLIESDIISNLAAPSQINDTFWIKPGMMAWDHWWSGDVQMDTATIKQYIQLASDMGWPYQLIDWQWYGPFNKPEADITHVNPKLDMDEVRRFAKEKRVRLWVWLHCADVDRNDAYKKAFPLYERWGIAGVKIDFMDRDDQEMVKWYEKITRAAAEHHLMVDFHGAFKTSGFDRTWPNQVTREGVIGNEYNRWSDRVTPSHRLTLPFTRFLEGPADFTPGGFLNRQPGAFVADKKAAEVQSTRCGELATFVAYDSWVCCACDYPDHYRDQPGADFLKIVPTVWDDSRVIDGEPAEYLTIARRSGKDWFLASMTNEQPRDVKISLDFLKSGKWTMQLWRDAADSDVNAEHLTFDAREVTAKDVVQVHLAPAGGCVARFHCARK